MLQIMEKVVRFLAVANDVAKVIATVILVTGAVTFGYSFIEGRVDPVMGPLTFEDIRQVDGEEFAVRFESATGSRAAGMLGSGLRPAPALAGRGQGRQKCA
jgi:hypothetical protein